MSQGFGVQVYQPKARGRMFDCERLDQRMPRGTTTRSPHDADGWEHFHLQQTRRLGGGSR